MPLSERRISAACGAAEPRDDDFLCRMASFSTGWGQMPTPVNLSEPVRD
jgi:hypothetical protein